MFCNKIVKFKSAFFAPLTFSFFKKAIIVQKIMRTRYIHIDLIQKHKYHQSFLVFLHLLHNLTINLSKYFISNPFLLFDRIKIILILKYHE